MRRTKYVAVHPDTGRAMTATLDSADEVLQALRLTVPRNPHLAYVGTVDVDDGAEQLYWSTYRTIDTVMVGERNDD